MSVATGGRPAAAGASTRRPKKPWPAHWPLSVFLLGYPLWWLLGVASFMPMIMAIPMLVQLLRHKKIFVPRGFAWWLLFLVWMLLGLFTLYADAPGAVPGGGGLGRVVVFGYRLSWYLTCTVALLWAANTTVRGLSVHRLCQLLGYMFVVTVGGGLLGVFFADLEFPSLLEMALPGGIASDPYVSSLIHPGVAEVQTVLGHPEARPAAPFAFANAWGSNLSIFLPFFLVAWFRGTHHWQRYAAPFVLLVATIPVVYSLNRGLWGALGLGVLLLLVRHALRGQVAAIVAMVVVVSVSAFAFAASPLGDLVSERMDHQHSNDRRGQLLVQTLQSTLDGSPVVGFGSTRDVQGSFASIAGASTPDCPACGVPPLGTQGQIWLVIFSQGFGGMLLFLAFFVSAIARSWRCRTPIETVCTCVVLFTALEMFIYSSVGTQLLSLMLVIGLVHREQATTETETGSSRFVGNGDPLVPRLLSSGRLIMALVCAGAVVGVLLSVRAPTSYAARASVLLAPSPSFLVANDVRNLGIESKETTVDTEAGLLLSGRALDEVQETVGPGATRGLRDRVRLMAVPNTRVLTIEVRADAPGVAAKTVDALTQAYLNNRRDDLRERRQQVLRGLRQQVRYVGDPSDSLVSTANATTQKDEEMPVRVDRQTAVRQTLGDVLLTQTRAGEVIRTDEPHAIAKNYAVNVTSGGALGLAAAVVVICLFPLRRRAGSASNAGTRPRRAR